jgi:hypothetical protein
MAAVQKLVILLILEGRGKIEKIDGIGEIFNAVMQVGRRFRIFTNDQVIQLAGGFLLKDSADQESGRASL